MDIQILKQLEAAEQVTVKDLQIALLRAQNKTYEYKVQAELGFLKVQKDEQAAANALTAKLTELAKDAKLDHNGLQFDVDKLFFYVQTDKPATAATVEA